MASSVRPMINPQVFLIFGFPFLVIIPSASFTKSPFFVFPVKGMPVFAQCFSSVLGACSYPTQRVLPRSHYFQVMRVYARAISAKMVDLKSFGYWALMHFVRRSMGQLGFSFSSPKSPISIWPNTGYPFPATLSFWYWGNVGPKFRFESHKTGIPTLEREAFSNLKKSTRKSRKGGRRA